MYSNNAGLSLLEQKKLQWAREREEMVGLCGLWGSLDRSIRLSTPANAEQPRRNSLLPPIQTKSEEQKEVEEESETSGYLSDSPQNDCDSSTDSRSHAWSGRRENYWRDRKMQKNMRNESRMRGTPDSVLSTPEDRLKWGDRGVGVGHLWEPVLEIPESRLPQVFESYRATPRWLEKKLADSTKADILVINHDDEEKPVNNFLLGQNIPLPPEVLEERERKRKKALELQNAIRRQLEEREKKRKEDKENRLQEERREEERIMKERELERLRKEDGMRKAKEKKELEKCKEEAMKEALEAAENKAMEEKRKLKRKEMAEELEKINEAPEFLCKEEHLPIFHAPIEERKSIEPHKTLRDSYCQPDEEAPRQVTDSSSQFESTSSLQFLNMGAVADGGLAFVVDGGAGSLLVPPDTLQLLLMSPGQAAGALPVQVSERMLTPSKLRGSRIVADAATQTDRKCCSVSLSSVRSRRCKLLTGRHSGRSQTSEKSTSLERLNSHSHCTSSRRHRSKSQPRLPMGDRPKWGINRPAIQYMKQSEKDPHYMRRLKRRRRTKEVSTSTSYIEEKLLESEFQLLAFQTDEEIEQRDECIDRILANGFRMVSNPSSPKFVRIEQKKSPIDKEFEVILIKDSGVCSDDNNAAGTLEETGDNSDGRRSGLGPVREKEPDLCNNETSEVLQNDTENEVTSSHNTPHVFEMPQDVEIIQSNENTGERLGTVVIEEEIVSSPAPSTGGSDVKTDENWDADFEGDSNGLDTGKELDIVVIEEENVSSLPSTGRSTSKTDENGDADFEGDSNGLDAGKELDIGDIEEENVSSPPSTGRSASKTDENDGDADFEEDDEDEDNKSVVSASLPNRRKSELEVICQITALKMGLQRLANDVDSRCSTPASSFGEC